MSRESLRSKWIRAVASAEIGNATKALLLYFATTMTATGYVDTVSRDRLADLFRVHPQRIAERIQEAKRVGLLEQVDGTGTRGRRARYIATLPPRCVPGSGTHEAGFLTGERYALIGTHENALRTGARYAQHARALTTATRTRHDHVDDLRVERGDVPEQERSERRAPAVLLVAALSPSDGRRLACAGLRPVLAARAA